MRSSRAIALALLLLFVLATAAEAGGGDCYHYVNLLGRHHAAWWYGYREFPPTVNWWYPGVATGDWGVPFGTRL